MVGCEHFEIEDEGVSNDVPGMHLRAPCCIDKGPNGHIIIMILHSGFKAQDKPEFTNRGICRIHLFTWSFGALIDSFKSQWPRLQTTKGSGGPKMCALMSGSSCMQMACSSLLLNSEPLAR